MDTGVRVPDMSKRVLVYSFGYKEQKHFLGNITKSSQLF